MTSLIKIEPGEIEKRSFAIIENEFLSRTAIDPNSLDPAVFQITRRVIHATGDFSFADSLFFHPRAVRSGIESLRQGRNVFIDVGMGAAGINRTTLGKLGGRVICRINDPEIAALAEKNGHTRTETALRMIGDDNVGLVVIGNAPTALLAAMELVDRGELHPDLIVGVPVGFVNAAESKELLVQKNYPFITNTGRKGGSPVAVAIVNALLQLARAEEI